MSLHHGDKLFSFYEEEAIPTHGKYSFLGCDMGINNGFAKYIDGYIVAANLLYDNYRSYENYQIDFWDTVVYPICFLYRQVVELYIKHLYFKYSLSSDEEKKDFLNTVSHKLKKAWNKVKPQLNALLKKLGSPSSIDLSLIEEFVYQFDEFDPSSFRMRYPIKKDLTSVNPLAVKLDIIGLHSKMTDLFDMFKQLDSAIDNVLIDNNYDQELINRIIKVYNDSRSEIRTVSGQLAELSAREEQQKSEHKDSSVGSVIDFSEIDVEEDFEETELESYILNLQSEKAAVISLLIQVGKDISCGRCKLAKDKEERKKDFLKLIELTLKECEPFISFEGQYQNRVMCYTIFEKSHTLTSNWLNTAFDIADEVL